MTDDQINRAIAKAHLRKRYPEGYWVRNYCADLNAMHEAEKALNKTDLSVMGIWIARLLPKEGEWFHATARQRAEAFLRALGKWEEVQG